MAGSGRLRTVLRTLRTVAVWLLLGIAIGAVCGLIGAAFYDCVTLANRIFTSHPMLIWFLPLGGIVIVLLYAACRMLRFTGTDVMLDAIRTGEPVRGITAPLIFVSTVITHLFGGSAGREGAALQLGGTVGAWFGKVCRLDERDRRVALLCGMCALFSALFGTPVTAAVFALEVVSVGVMYYAALLPCLTASLVAGGIARLLGGETLQFHVAIPGIDMSVLWRTVVLSALCAGVSMLFCAMLAFFERFFRKRFDNPFWRVVIGGISLILLTYLSGGNEYNGSGMPVIHRALLEGQAFPAAFLWKMLFTSVTIGCGFKGGEIVPTLFIGATFGCTAGGLLGLSPMFGAAVGLIAVFCGVVNCPVASVILSVELFGSGGLPIFALSCAISYALSGYFGLYHSQHIVYSKLHPSFIDRPAH